MVLTPSQRQVAAAMTEDDGPDSLDANVRDLMKDLGLWGFHPRVSIGSKRGWPDWVILGPHGALFRELKTQRGDLSIDQRMVGSLLSKAGLSWCVWRPADLMDGTIARQLASIARPPRAPEGLDHP
jgi:hypothetical protein